MRRHRVLNVRRWRFSFWRGPTKLGVHLIGSWDSGTAGLGLFGVNWVRRTVRAQEARQHGE